jgi:hypothetical protein
MFNRKDNILDKYDIDEESYTNVRIKKDFTIYDTHLCNDKKYILNINDINYEYDPEALPRKKYRSKANEHNSCVIHWGQIKLMISEIQFITEYGHLSDTIVYAGSAPGHKNADLMRLFPDHKFVFVDPAPLGTTKYTLDGWGREFLKEIEKDDLRDRVEVISDYFTEDIATKYMNALLISDIRTADTNSNTNEEVEKIVTEFDNPMQMNWGMSMNSPAGMLKFRLGWDDVDTEYLKADKIYMPVYGPVHTTESRLVYVGTKDGEDSNANGPYTKYTYEMDTYHNKEYEENFFYFNTVIRPFVHYERDFYDGKNKNGICHCHDCTAFLLCCKKYINHMIEKESLPSFLTATTKKIVEKADNMDSMDKKDIVKLEMDAMDKVIDNMVRYVIKASARTLKNKSLCTVYGMNICTNEDPSERKPITVKRRQIKYSSVGKHKHRHTKFLGNKKNKKNRKKY